MAVFRQGSRLDLGTRNDIESVYKLSNKRTADKGDPE